MTTRRSLLPILLAAAAAPAWLRHARAADVDRFPLGVASGCPRPDGVVLWTRVGGPGLPEQVEVQWELSRDEGFRDVVARGREIALALDAHCVRAEPQGLAPSRWYFYRWSALGQQSRAGRTRTAPALEADEPLRFAIASCQRWDHGLYAAWRHMAAQDLDLVLFLGDYLYENGGTAEGTRVRQHRGPRLRTLEQYRDRHAQYKGDLALQAMHARAPWILTWDDHEVDNDYAGEQGQELQPDFAQQRAAAYQAYWEHMPLPKSARPRDGTMRLFERYDWGRLARIHALDDRQYRSPQACPRPGRGGSNTVPVTGCPALADPSRTLLGAVQERWLEAGWSTAHGWNLVAQQTLMAGIEWRDPARPGEPMAWTDGWDGYAAARDRLLAGVAERRLPGVVVLGGDVHAHFVADLRRDRRDAAGPVLATEFCGTSISSEGPSQARLAQAMAWNPHLRYARSDQRGYVQFRLDRDHLHAELMAVADPRDAASAVTAAARFAVVHGRPGAVPA